MTSKVEYLGIEWTQVRLNPACMKIQRKNNGLSLYTDYSIHDDMLSWLYSETGPRQSSRIVDSDWWWDKDDPKDTKSILFHFRDPTVALKFKLTWGTVCHTA